MVTGWALAATQVATPVFASTVAVAVLLEPHVSEGTVVLVEPSVNVPVAVKWTVAPPTVPVAGLGANASD